MVTLRIDGFDWDDGNREKCRKHGVSASEIEAVLKNSPRVAPDITHSTLEERFIAVGRTSRGRPVFVAFTVRTKEGRRLIRPVTARYMHKKEIDACEKTEPESAKTKNR
jgi:uncharacterized DUF497 family protein